MTKQGDEAVARKTDTILITCSLDNQAHHVTDDSVIAGQRTGLYQALCGHLVPAAALATPLGRPCANCVTVSVAHQQTLTMRPARRYRHRQPGWLRRILLHQRNANIAMAGASLTGTDRNHWIALRRVLDGEVTRLDGCWLHHGHLVPGYVTDALDELLTGGLVTLAGPDPIVYGRTLAALTNDGIARFEQLCRTALGLSNDDKFW